MVPDCPVGHCRVLSNQLFLGYRDRVGQANSVSNQQLSHFLLCEVSSLVEGNVIRETIVGSKASCVSMNDCVDTNPVDKKDQSTYILNIDITENQLMPTQ